MADFLASSRLGGELGEGRILPSWSGVDAESDGGGALFAWVELDDARVSDALRVEVETVVGVRHRLDGEVGLVGHVDDDVLEERIEIERDGEPRFGVREADRHAGATARQAVVEPGARIERPHLAEIEARVDGDGG